MGYGCPSIAAVQGSKAGEPSKRVGAIIGSRRTQQFVGRRSCVRLICPCYTVLISCLLHGQEDILQARGRFFRLGRRIGVLGIGAAGCPAPAVLPVLVRGCYEVGFGLD